MLLDEIDKSAGEGKSPTLGPNQPEEQSASGSQADAIKPSDPMKTPDEAKIQDLAGAVAERDQLLQDWLVNQPEFIKIKERLEKRQEGDGPNPDK